jgi:hypothetical protein
MSLGDGGDCVAALNHKPGRFLLELISINCSHTHTSLALNAIRMCLPNQGKSTEAFTEKHTDWIMEKAQAGATRT